MSNANPLVVDLQRSLHLLQQIPIESILDIRAIGEDLELLLSSGRKVILQQGALKALQEPLQQIEFFDGVLTLEKLFQQTELHEFHGPGSAQDVVVPACPALIGLASEDRHFLICAPVIGVLG